MEWDALRCQFCLVGHLIAIPAKEREKDMIRLSGSNSIINQEERKCPHPHLIALSFFLS